MVCLILSFIWSGRRKNKGTEAGIECGTLQYEMEYRRIARREKERRERGGEVM